MNHRQEYITHIRNILEYTMNPIRDTKHISKHLGQQIEIQ